MWNDSLTDLEGGPLEHKYQIAQFHFHWGKDDCSGSEHRVDGHMYASEVSVIKHVSISA